jgi:hypothetical protein
VDASFQLVTPPSERKFGFSFAIVFAAHAAFRCFMGTELDMLAVGNCLLDKADQDPSLAARYERSFGLD